MSSAQKIAWSLIEDAVQRENGIDEELALVHVIRSYLIRRGLANTLTAFDYDVLASAHPALDFDNVLVANVTNTTPNEVNAESKQNNNYMCYVLESAYSEEQQQLFINEIQTRKEAQLLCLNAQYEDAAKLLPFTSVVRFKLLCMAALHEHVDLNDRLLFITQHITPLVVICDNPRIAHTLYLAFISKLMNVMSSSSLSMLSPSLHLDCAVNGNGVIRNQSGKVNVNNKDALQIRKMNSITKLMQYALAREINEVLLADKSPNAVDVLLLWSDWLEHVSHNLTV